MRLEKGKKERNCRMPKKKLQDMLRTAHRAACYTCIRANEPNHAGYKEKKMKEKKK